MKRSKVKKIFWFFILFLPLQYAAVGVIGLLQSEPWPALVLPAFKSVYEQEDNILLKNAQFYLIDEETGNRFQVATTVLFRNIQQSQRLGFLKTNFGVSKKDNFGKKTKRWLRFKINSLFPYRNPDALRVVWVGKRYVYSKSGVQSDSPVTLHSYTISFKNE